MNIKKWMASVLALLLIVAAFAGCNSAETSNSDLENAKAYLINMYQTGSKGETMKMDMDKDVVSAVTIDGVQYGVNWAISVTQGDADAVVVVVSDKANHVKIDVPDLPDYDVLFTATATIISAAGEYTTAEFKYKVGGLYGTPTTAPADGDATTTAPADGDATTTAPTEGNTTAQQQQGNTTAPQQGATTTTTKAPTTTTTTQAPANNMHAIVDAAYALAAGAAMDNEVTLTGKVTYIKTAYDAQFQNVTVEIVIEGREDKPILCYRMKGTDADKVTGGDTITVTGTIKNYNGTIEFDAGCVLRKRESGGVVALTNPVDIVNAAYALEPKAYLPYTVTLTGTITEINTEYSSQYNNITVTIEIAGIESKPIKCYRMKGTGADSLKVGDVITVTGAIKNHQHSSGDCEVEFDTGCTFVK